MDLGSFFVVLALLILVVGYVSQPFWDNQKRRPITGKRAIELPDEKQQKLSFLLAERDRILNALQELDFDAILGKIPEEDYPAQRATLVKNGANVLRQLDILQVRLTPAEHEKNHGARLEAVLSAHGTETQNGRRSRATVPDDALERQIAARRRERQEKAAGFCPQCGAPVQKSDLFCPKCGTRIA